jgi:hypothetical protein
MSRRLAVPLVAAALGALASAAAASPLPGAPNCPLYPASNPWNQRVDRLPRAAGSATLMRRMAIPHLHPDFGSVYGIPYNVASASTPRYRVRFQYASESDPGPYPIPAGAKIEDGSDAHLLVVDRDNCHLYELFAADRGGGGWAAGSGAIWNLESNAVRPATWTSADAAGLPILPGLARYDEAARGAIDHALRFTLAQTQAAFVYPARHLASSIHDPAAAPMGLRLRLKASYRIGRFNRQARIVLQALKTYGMIVADNGSSGYVTGAPDKRWSDDALHVLHQVPGSAFEVVDTSSLTGFPRARIWNTVKRVLPKRVGRRFFLTRDARVTLSAVVRGRVRARTTRRLRQGLDTLSVKRVRGARYRLRIG